MMSMTDQNHSMITLVMIDTIELCFVCMQLWLCDVEKAMHVTLKYCLKDCLSALKKMAAQRDKWVKDWPGQVHLSLLFSVTTFLYSDMLMTFCP